MFAPHTAQLRRSWLAARAAFGQVFDGNHPVPGGRPLPPSIGRAMPVFQGY